MKKKIVKKNRLVILALAVMIGVAGYLNFNAERKNALEKKSEDKAADVEVISYENDKNHSLAEQVAAENSQAAGTSEEADAAGQKENADGEKAAEESGEQPQKTEVAQLDEQVELNSDEDEIGEAVLTNAEIVKNNISAFKLNREQLRSKNKQAFLDIMQDEAIADDVKQEACANYVKLSDTIEKENAAENLLNIKGFADAIVTINDDTVDVSLNVESLTDTQRAQIEDVVTRKTGYDVSQLVISVMTDK